MGRTAFPIAGSPAGSVLDELRSRKADDVDWRAGRTSLYVQFGGDDVHEVSRQAADLYFSENAHGAAAFPSVQRLQSEVIGHLLDLLNAGAQGDGCLTASGSESIFLAMKVARDWARARRPDRGTPQAIVPASAHPAFDKAGGMLGIEVVRVPVRADYRADAAAMNARIGERTIFIAGSAPQFAHGVVDPIGELAGMARERDLWLHVDACIGALIAPFARLAGTAVPAFDFEIEGVRSISADLHKYGFAAKGISAVLFRHACYRPHYVFEFDDWPIGSYTSNGLAGTRSAATIASAWAVMHYLGKEGFARIARQILEASGRLIDGLRRIDGVEPVGQPDLPIVAWRAPGLPIDAVAEQMRGQGWFVRTMARPAAIHMGMLSLHQARVIDDYLASVARSVRALR